jgi:hypothetical protein
MKNHRQFNERWRGTFIVLAVLLVFVLAGVGGCTSTVTPDVVQPAQASYGTDGQRNSGLLDRTLAGWIVDESFRARYNALIDKYGDDFLVPLHRDDGLLPRGDGTWLLDFAHFDKMAKMNTWLHMGKAK